MLNVNFIRDCLLRCVCIILVINLMAYNNINIDEDTRTFTTVVIMISVLIFEPVFYLNNRAKANLFLKMQLATLQ